MDPKTRGLVKGAGLAAGLAAAAIGAGMAFKRVRYPFDGTPLPFLGDTKPLGTRYCKTCQHYFQSAPSQFSRIRSHHTSVTRGSVVFL